MSVDINQRLVIFRSLASVTCPCSAKKHARHSFCVACFRKLPDALRQDLYRSDGYVETWIEAMQLLELDPALAPKPSPQLELL